MGRLQRFWAALMAAAIYGFCLIPILWLFAPYLTRPRKIIAALSILSDARRSELMRNSLAVGAGTTLLAIVFGLIVAFALLSLRGRLRVLLAGASLIPIIVPPFLQAVAWIEILNAGGSPPFTAHGLIASLGFSEQALAVLESCWVLSLAFFPCVTYLIVIALSRRPWELEEDARLHGDRRAVRMHVLWPTMAASTLTGALLVFFCHSPNLASPIFFSVAPIRAKFSCS